MPFYFTSELLFTGERHLPGLPPLRTPSTPAGTTVATPQDIAKHKVIVTDDMDNRKGYATLHSIPHGKSKSYAESQREAEAKR